MDIQNLIVDSFSTGGWVRYNKTIAREFGVYASIILGNIIDKYTYFEGQAFFMLREDIEFETALTDTKQRQGEKALSTNNLIKVTALKQPNGSRLNYYTVNFNAIGEFLSMNTKNLKDKKERKQEFYREELAKLNNSTWPGEENQVGQLKNIDRNKNKVNKNKKNNSSTTNFSEGASTAYTPAKGTRKNITESKEYKELVTAYTLEVDASYVPAPKDNMSFKQFAYPERLLSYIPYWKAYIGSTEKYQYRGNTLDDFDKKHTAQIHVMIKHWNNFSKFADSKILAEKQYTAAFGEQA